MGGAIRPTPHQMVKSWLISSVMIFKQAYIYMTFTLVSIQSYMVSLSEICKKHGQPRCLSTIAWTPDNAQLVFWAGDTIHKLDVMINQYHVSHLR